ncbi:DUF721 domain-containing protein [Anaplasma ovis]|nr:DUF721 domain-containing protein [Anaplasma ovis]
MYRGFESLSLRSGVLLDFSPLLLSSRGQVGVYLWVTVGGMYLLAKRRGCRNIRSVVESFVLQKCEAWRLSRTEIRIMLNWRDIVGVRIAELARPDRVVFSKDNSGTLHLRVANGGHAMFIQYAIPGIIEKISVYFGFKAISSVKIQQ